MSEKFTQDEWRAIHRALDTPWRPAEWEKAVKAVERFKPGPDIPAMISAWVGNMGDGAARQDLWDALTEAGVSGPDFGHYWMHSDGRSYFAVPEPFHQAPRNAIAIF